MTDDNESVLFEASCRTHNGEPRTASEGAALEARLTAPQPPPAPMLRPSAIRATATVVVVAPPSQSKSDWLARAWLPALAIASCAGSYCFVAQWVGAPLPDALAQSAHVESQPMAAGAEDRAPSSAAPMDLEALPPSAANAAAGATPARPRRGARGASKSPARSAAASALGPTSAPAHAQPASDVPALARPKDRGF